MTELPVYIDLEASFAALEAGEHDQGGMLKFPTDLARYKVIINETRPDVIVETGTRTGASARWFAEQGDCRVITVDDFPNAFEGSEVGITRIVGNSVDSYVMRMIEGIVNGSDWRCMVVLDSAHNAAHVRREIELYSPLVALGCYLVVEDAIWGYAEPAVFLRHGEGGMVGSPLDAILDRLVGNPAWARDVSIEQMSPVSHNPAGWWRRVSDG